MEDKPRKPGCSSHRRKQCVAAGHGFVVDLHTYRSRCVRRMSLSIIPAQRFERGIDQSLLSVFLHCVVVLARDPVERQWCGRIECDTVRATRLLPQRLRGKLATITQIGAGMYAVRVSTLAVSSATSRYRPRSHRACSATARDKMRSCNGPLRIPSHTSDFLNSLTLSHD